MSSRVRVTVDGKFFRLGGQKFFPKGVSYGPFAPDPPDPHFPPPQQAALDFAQIRALEANLLRVHHLPPRWFVDLAADHGLRLLVDIPWPSHLCFADSRQARAEARAAVRAAVSACAGHPAVFAFSLANEIPPDIVRWTGPRAVGDFIDSLAAEARRADPGCLCTFANFPPTEFLRPQSLDFFSFNVYLHQRPAFKNYLARLQMIADSKPLLLAEFGIDSGREGAAEQAAILSWQIEDAFRAGLAGAIVFSYTDDWWRGGRPVEDWNMGLTTRDRLPKEAFAAVRDQFHLAPDFPLPRVPRVSVVVASYQGASTLPACLDSLDRLRYPDFEVILVDDGSTDDTTKIASAHPRVRYFRHLKNLGLGVARNTGIEAATGEIIAFTDADCRADEDWLRYLVGDLLETGFAGIGGHNLLPPDASPASAAVMVSPGGPAHVMLSDREAEHVPGCNMAFYKWALADVRGFDPIFRRAGDDVDLCWRLQRSGCQIGFSPAGFVWHCRRSTFAAYLRQQRGYGEAEALLVQKHPESFSALGGSIWQGRIYASSRPGILMSPPIVYHGVFASGMFQTLYTPQPVGLLSFFSSIEYHVLVTLPLIIISVSFPRLLPLAIVSFCLSLGVCIAAAVQAALPPAKRRWWSRPAVALLFFLQPIVRGWARYRGQLVSFPRNSVPPPTLDSLALSTGPRSLDHVSYWAPQGLDRIAFVAAVVKALKGRGWPHKPDSGWSDFDVRIFGNRWTQLELTTVSEEHPRGARLLRCRLRTAWTLRAQMAFWVVLAIELVVSSLIGLWWPWFVAAIITIAAFAWFLARQERVLQSLVVLLLDELAHDWNLTPVSTPSTPESPQGR
jgi:GT2 family glycosyltransferase